jgi:ankyrin repeat protein
MKDEYGLTPLTNAVNTGCKRMISLLLKLGANVNEKNICGNTALYYACKKYDYDIMRLLIRNDAKITNDCEQKAFDYAIERIL